MKKRSKKKYIAISIIFLLVICYVSYRYVVNKFHSNDKSTVNVKKTDKKPKENIKGKEDKKQNNSNIYTKESDVKSRSNSSKNTPENITVNQAVKIATECYADKDENTKFVFDHEDTRDNIQYYVIQVFDSMEDHSATSAWYYVNKKDGSAYQWDLGENKLIPAN